MGQQKITLTVEPEAEHCVYVKDFVETRYGPKAVLGGDTYEVLSSHGMNAAGDLDFHEHHCAFDQDREAWTIDPAGDSLEALDEALRDRGMRLNGLSARLGERVTELVDKDEGAYWRDLGVEVEVMYETKQSGNTRTKSGVVTSVDPRTGRVGFERDDLRTNFVHGSSILSQNSRYPYMGDVVRVEVEVSPGA